ncbi:MAG: Uncharacterized protein Greene071436_289 [Parcubacteria group bacterium Greene0714_36]|nr:MAG: Uncharacterized protein Greene071436_289 [Parcubacteria group bacterium Greene0714_36]
MFKIFAIVGVIAILGAGVWYLRQETLLSPIPLFYENNGVPAEKTRADESPAAESMVLPQAVIIRYTDDGGYIPATVAVKKGATVTFKNDSMQDTWPASAMHPTHAGYPETGGCLGSTFDICRGLKPGENWDFTFNVAGEWGYHDHLHARQFGSVTVEE